MTVCSSLLANAAPIEDVTTQCAFPCTESGIDMGVSACFAGALSDRLLMIGGCNFPNDALRKDSQKRFYRGIYMAKAMGNSEMEWQMVGTLPEPLAYGVSAVWHEALYVVGGMNDAGSRQTVYRITLSNDKAQIETLAPLPQATDNMAGTVVGSHLYIVGGVSAGKPSNAVFRLDLAHTDKGWTKQKSLPGSPRVQPLVGQMGEGKLCVFGGFVPPVGNEEGKLATDGWCYDEDSDSWSPLDGPKDAAGNALFVAGGTAINLSSNRLLVLGGVNTNRFLSAVNAPQADYLQHPVEWYQFNQVAMVYEPEGWSMVGSNASFARAGATAARVGDWIYVIGGELKPRVRSNQIVSFPIKTCSASHKAVEQTSSKRQ